MERLSAGAVAYHLALHVIEAYVTTGVGVIVLHMECRPVIQEPVFHLFGMFVTANCTDSTDGCYGEDATAQHQNRYVNHVVSIGTFV